MIPIGNPGNHGYLPAIVLKELSLNRSCEITGSILCNVRNRDDYLKYKDRLMGKFGEVVQRKEQGTVLISTRDPPRWARIKIHSVIWDCEEMLRWMVPEDMR